jgi:hypothetical protein
MSLDMNYAQMLYLFIWYTTEYLCYIAIIAFVLYKFNLIKPFKMKNDVPATFGHTWDQTNIILAGAADLAKKVRTVIDVASQPQAPQTDPKLEGKKE